MLVICRREDGLPLCERDRAEIAAISPDRCLTSRSAMSDVRYGLQNGWFDLPPAFWARVYREILLKTDLAPWHHAVCLLAAWPDTQACAVETIAETVESAADPTWQFGVFAKSPLLSGGIFVGRGWGRDELPQKLLPIARVLVRRRAWPAASWHHSFLAGPVSREKGVPRADAAERAHERTREVLAEAFLDRALDRDEAAQTRAAALGAIGVLNPGGNGGVARAMGKFKTTELAACAKEVGRKLRDGRVRRIDAELGVLEAWEYFVANAAPALPGSNGAAP